MNYYHAFVPGFNYWYIAAPVAAFIALLAGVICQRRDNVFRMRHGRKSKRIEHANDIIEKVILAALAVIQTVMVFVESRDGVLQWFDNGGGDPLANLFAVFFAILMFGGVLFLVDVLATRLGEYLVRSYYGERNITRDVVDAFVCAFRAIARMIIAGIKMTFHAITYIACVIGVFLFSAITGAFKGAFTGAKENVRRAFSDEE